MAHTNDMSDMVQSLALDEPHTSIYDLVIDFGTTFTKAAVLRISPPHESRIRDPAKSLLDYITIIDRYPGLHNSKRLIDEVPTTSVYDGKTLVDWGVDSHDLHQREENGYITLSLVKLLLDESDRGATEKDKVKAKLKLLDLRLVDVLADYLRSLLRHASRIIDNEDLGEKQIRVILAIPAIWKSFAQKIMRDACKNALCKDMVLRDQEDHGMKTEPEAVAAFLMEKYPELDVVGGDLIGVLDCGGGTSDFALLDILQRNPTHMSQAAHLNGGMFGSIFLDEAFEKLLRRRISHVMLPSSKRESGIRKAIEEFKYLKPSFEIGQSPKRSISFEGLADDPQHGITPGRVWFTEAEFRNIFDPIARGNINLVVETYETYRKTMEREKTPAKNLKYLFFVGGLSGSVYMEVAIRNTFSMEQKLGHRVRVHTTSSNAATAIVQGAHLLASNVSIMKDVRIPDGYAIVSNEPWMEYLHGNKVRKYKDENTKGLIVKNRVQMLVQKDDIIRDTHKNSTIKVSEPLSFTFKLGEPRDAEVNLWRCSERVEDHADLAELRAAGVISLVYTLKFNLEGAVDACTEYSRIPGVRGFWTVTELERKEQASLPRMTRSTTKARAGEIDSVSQNEKLDFDITNDSNGSLNLIQSVTSVPPTRRDTFFAYKCQVVLRIAGSSSRFEVEAPPGGPVQQSTELTIPGVEEI